MRQMHVPLIALLFVALPAAGQVKPGQVRVSKAPAAVEKKMFDPKNRPSDMPESHGNEQGVVKAHFTLTTQPGFTPGTKKQEADGKWTANVRTQQMEMQLALKLE